MQKRSSDPPQLTQTQQSLDSRLGALDMAGIWLVPAELQKAGKPPLAGLPARQARKRSPVLHALAIIPVQNPHRKSVKGGSGWPNSRSIMPRRRARRSCAGCSKSSASPTTSIAQPRRRRAMKPDYLAVNPMGKVPALKHGDTVITEAAAICTYLADEFPHAQAQRAGRRPAPWRLSQMAVLRAELRRAGHHRPRLSAQGGSRAAACSAMAISTR